MYLPLCEQRIASLGLGFVFKPGVETVLVTAQMECVFILRRVVSRKHLSKGKTKFQQAEALLEQSPRDEVQDHC